jgi:hypothetical protein
MSTQKYRLIAKPKTHEEKANINRRIDDFLTSQGAANYERISGIKALYSEGLECILNYWNLRDLQEIPGLFIVKDQSINHPWVKRHVTSRLEELISQCDEAELHGISRIISEALKKVTLYQI